MRNSIMTFTAVVIFLCGSAADLSADEILYARYPALSPDNRTIAFTYMGDIWIVPSTGGVAHRITVHEAEDIRPQYSPDGTMILFSSNRYDNYDLFIMPAEGGSAEQLTFHSGSDIGTGWFPGGDTVLFTSGRGGYRDIYKVSIEGGTPIELTGYGREQEYNGTISSDGRYLLFNNGSGLSRWWRRDLKASKNADIFLQDRTGAEFTSRRLTDNPAHDLWPILNEEKDEVYFVSCRGDWAQVWKMPLAGGDAIPLTNFEGDGVQWLNSNPQGTKLVFEQDFHIWVMDPAGEMPRVVPITVRTDERTNLVEKRNFNGKVQWFSLSPDEKKIVAVIHGEIFVLPAEDPKEGIRLTFTAARERYPVWGSDSRVVYYCSDRGGNYDIYSADVTTGKETQLTATPENDLKPVVSPNGKMLAFYRGLRKIMRLEISSGEEVEWIDGKFFDLGVERTIEYGWSPDSRWLTFTMAGPTYETDIFVASLDGDVHNISQFAGYNYRPRFSSDGKLIYFSSWLNDRENTLKIDLVHKPPEFFETAFDSLFIEKPEKKDKDDDKDDNGNGDDKEDTLKVKIEFDRIEKRRVKAYDLSASSNFPVLTPDGKKYLFVASLLGKPEIWSVNTEDEQELTQLTHGGKEKRLLTVTGDSKKVLYLEDGLIKETVIDGGKTNPISFTAALDIDARDLNRQKFHESWQILNSYFYDADFHGADWAAVYDKYEPVVNHVRTEPEFRNMVKEMLGELRASHLNIYSTAPGPDKNVKTAATGIILDYKELDTTGNYRIKNIIPGTPAALSGIKAGQYITAVNGQSLLAGTNIFRMLAGTADHRLILNISDRPGEKGEEIAVKPVTSIDDQIYNDWVATRRRAVDSLSDGRLAYLHIRSMSGTCLEQFKEELVSIAEKKEGLIIDVRDNGGGNIAVHLLGILVKTPYFLRSFRDFPVTSENKMRSKALEKPMNLLINSYSASNSEIFAEGFRKLKLGKIIGEPTAGAVIGTSSYTLIDGTRIRRPSWGAYTTEMEDTDLIPRQPDIFVENLPDDFINGRDPQLVRAVRELMKELK